VSRKFTMLFAIAFVSAFSAAACSGVEQEVREQVDQEIQEGREQVEQEIQEGREQVEQEIQEGRTQIAEEIEGQ
jgi:hypothetical protein